MKNYVAAASARLCVETIKILKTICFLLQQPPPRGCVLKHFNLHLFKSNS